MAAALLSGEILKGADPNTLALLYSPPERLYLDPKGKWPNFIVSKPRDWTWATHWQPLPAPPADSEGGK